MIVYLLLTEKLTFNDRINRLSAFSNGMGHY